jgi:hypothetical protein
MFYDDKSPLSIGRRAFAVARQSSQPDWDPKFHQLEERLVFGIFLPNNIFYL